MNSFDFKNGDDVLSVYGDKKGKIVSVIPTNEMQDYYRVHWEDNTETVVAREEIY